MSAEPNLSVPTSDNQSRPLYQRLELVPGAQQHLIVVEGSGLDALERVIDSASDDDVRKISVLYWSTSKDQDEEQGRFANVPLKNFEQADSFEEISQIFENYLENATMGTRIYVAGSEETIGLFVTQAMQHRVVHSSILTERCGSLARRVQCVHCKTSTGGITTSYYTCPGCDRVLLVRDHYSRRHSAYQGVHAQAEDPEEVVEPEEVFR